MRFRDHTVSILHGNGNTTNEVKTDHKNVNRNWTAMGHVPERLVLKSHRVQGTWKSASVAARRLDMRSWAKSGSLRLCGNRRLEANGPFLWPDCCKLR